MKTIIAGIWGGVGLAVTQIVAPGYLGSLAGSVVPASSQPFPSAHATTLPTHPTGRDRAVDGDVRLIQLGMDRPIGTFDTITNKIARFAFELHGDDVLAHSSRDFLVKVYLDHPASSCGRLVKATYYGDRHALRTLAQVDTGVYGQSFNPNSCPEP